VDSKSELKAFGIEGISARGMALGEQLRTPFERIHRDAAATHRYGSLGGPAFLNSSLSGTQPA